MINQFQLNTIDLLLEYLFTGFQQVICLTVINKSHSYTDCLHFCIDKKCFLFVYWLFWQCCAVIKKIIQGLPLNVVILEVIKPCKYGFKTVIGFSKNRKTWRERNSRCNKRSVFIAYNKRRRYHSDEDFWFWGPNGQYLISKYFLCFGLPTLSATRQKK